MKYFGTDGFRGRVSEKLNADLAFKIGRYLGYYFNLCHLSENRVKMIIGKDTRISCDILEHALASGAASMGVDVYLLGVTPTPVVSYLIRKENYDFGAMISASHNPFVDNGIKIFNDEGFKLQEEVEMQIEAYLDSNDFDKLSYANNESIGRITNIHEVGLSKYAEWLYDICPFDFSELKVLVDLANGSATSIVASVLRHYKAQVDIMASEPNGININLKCGSTHLDAIQDRMISGNYDIGIAFDGDADRLLAVDEHGNVVDGDVIMYLCAKYLNEKGLLNNQTLVTTIMSNIGLYKALAKLDIKTRQVSVGDKYVSECMYSENLSLGGEQSGHIIFGNHCVTGDGLLSAIYLLEILKQSEKSFNVLASEVQLYPQLLKNVSVKSKKTVIEDEDVLAACKSVEKALGDNGRILVRSSGTEELVRVMVEAQSDDLCQKYVEDVIKVIKNKAL